MIVIKSIAYSILAILSVLSLIIVKFALSENHNKKIKKKQNSQNIYSHKQVFIFLVKRFTFLEIFLIKKIRFKLSQNLSLALHLFINFFFKNGFFWSWLVTISLCVALFIFTDTYIQSSNDTLQQQNSINSIIQQIPIRKIFIYGMYSILSMVIYLTFCYYFYYSNVNLTFLYQTFLPALVIDQFLGRPIFFILIGLFLSESKSLIFLIQTYNELQKISQQIKKIENNSVVLPILMGSKNKQIKRLSPSKIPKAINRLQIQNNFEIQPKSTLNNQTCQVDSLINILQQSHKKNIQNSKHLYNNCNKEGFTPNKNTKSCHKSVQNSQEIVNNHIIIKSSPNFEQNKFKSPLQISGQKKNLRIIPQLQKNYEGDDALNNLSEIKPVQEFNQNSKNKHSRYSKDRVQQSGKKSNKCKFTFEDHQIQEMNTYEIQSKQSRSNNKKQLSDNQSPNSVKGSKYSVQLQSQIIDMSNRKKGYQDSSLKKNSIHYIEQQPQEQYTQNKQFELDSLGGSHFPFTNTSQQYIVENDKTYKLCDQNSQTQQNKNTLLQIKEQNQIEIQQLSSFDMNSLMKQSNQNQQNILGNIKLKSQLNNHNIPSRYKKRPLHKRDIKQLKKLNSDSPYLEYLPNMLSKQIQNSKKLHQKQIEQKSKRGRNTRYQSNHKQLNKYYRHKIDTQLNNQNACPKIFYEEDF